MDSRSWALLSAAFEQLADLEPAERDARWRALEGEEPALAEPALRDELVRMLRADSAARVTAGGAAPEAAPLPRLIGRYEVRGLLGEGGFGAVYRAFDPALRREVAVKVASLREPTARERFRREAAIAARLAHPRIVTVHDHGESEDGRLYLVQELLTGEDLDQLLARGEPRSLAAREQVLRDVVEGLAFAHAARVVHRDVKPANVRVLPDGRAKLLDFGIARTEEEAAATLTRSGTAVGTLAFLAPEVLRGDTADARADVWGLGAVAYQLLSFRAPFGARSPAALVYDIVHGERPRLAANDASGEIPPHLVAWVERCLERDPERRFRDAGEAQSALFAGTVAPPPASRGRTAILVGTVLGAAILIALIALWPRSPVKPVRDATAAERPPLAASSFAARAAEPTIAPLAAALPAGTGLVAVDARPWGRVAEIASAQGDLLPLPDDTRTPLALELPAGTWRILVLAPDGAGSRRCTVEVPRSGAPGPLACRAFFARPDVRGWVVSQR